MRVAKVDGTKCVGSEAAHDLVEQVGGACERFLTVPTSQDVTHNPNAITVLFSIKKLVGQEAEHATEVRVGRVDVGVEVVLVPKVGVERHDTQTLTRRHREGTVVGLDFLDLVVIDPAAALPKLGNIVQVPVKTVGSTVRERLRLNHQVQRRRVVVAKSWDKRRLAEIGLHNIVLSLLGV